ncbi:GGDEF domain-containing protein [Kangiella koreensis]|uniref:diguanylate cyclase n=1 Tax=Kangiella koreensis (strain DSM 16069 / JCM 12317 / KCTC 12182 / SW-125) TaxID=523791 RepID=C7R6M0_KANKD|nr:GGDEF domain-containing protein [Kangiella koreensis]ACV25536.1 diguanylate cyclase [Kangiella koreensis DSM 16069]
MANPGKRTLLLLTSICLLILVIASPKVKAETYQDIIQDIGQTGRVSPKAVLDRLEWADAIPDERSSMDDRANYYLWLGKFAALSRDYDKADLALKQLASLTETFDCNVCGENRYIVEAYIAARQNNVSALEALLKEIEASNDEPLKKLQSLELHAFLYNAKSMIPEIIETAFEAAELSEQLNRPSDHIRALNYIVLANIHRRDLERAMILATEAYEKAKKLNDVEQMVNTRGNQGWIYSLQGDYEKQADCLRDTIAITDQYPDMEVAAMTNRINLSHNLIERKLYQEAIDVADEAVSRAETLKHPVGRAVAIHNRAIGVAYVEDREQGIKELQAAIQLAESEGAKSYALDMYRSLAQLYEEFEEHQNAVTAYKKIIELESELIKSEREDAVQALQEQYETEKKNREIERLSLEKVAADAEIAEKEARQKLWIALAIVFLLIAVILIQWLRTSRKRNKDLADDNVQLTKQTDRDPLTGAYNRRFLQKTMQELHQKLKNLDRPGRADDVMGIILLDVDFFKNVNDTYGHAVGDAVLVEITKRFRKLLRERDMVVRWGGEEFVLLLPNVNGALCNVADRAINKIGNETFNFEGQQLRITISAGCVTWPAFEEQSWEEALHLADMAAYLSKSGGRNRATCITKINQDSDKKELAKDLLEAEKKSWIELTRIAGPRAE